MKSALFSVALFCPAALSVRDSAPAHGLPLGDGKISGAPKMGHVISCASRFAGAGAHETGEWIGADRTPRSLGTCPVMKILFAAERSTI